MSRGLSSANANAASAAVVRPVYLARMNYASEDVLVTSAPFNIKWDWNGDDVVEEFLGVGGLGGMSSVQESSAIQTYSVTLELSGIPDEALYMALNEHYQGRDCRIWKGFLDENHQFVDTPFVLFRGRMDTQTIDLVEKKISLVVHSRLTDWFRPRVRRFTNEDQQGEYPGDKGFEFVSQMVEKQLIWGQ